MPCCVSFALFYVPKPIAAECPRYASFTLPGVMRDLSGASKFLILAVFGAGMLIAGCDEAPRACTDEFVTYSVKVLSPDGQPADSVMINVRNADTGKKYDVCEALSQCNDPGERQYVEEGRYFIFHDGLEVSPMGNDVVVTGSKDSRTFRADYVFRAGECHVQKEKGPEQVMLSE